MNNKNIKVFISVLFVAIIFATWFIMQGKDTVQNSDKNTKTSQTTAVSSPEWNSYENTAYYYKIKYPKLAIVSGVEELSKEKSENVSFILEGKNSPLDILVLLSRNGEPALFGIERKDLLVLNSRSFSEKIRQYQIDNKNPYEPDKKVGELKEIFVQNRKAYSFTLTDGFSYGERSGYSLENEVVHNYIIIESKKGDKFIIHYPLGDKISEAMMSSFEFTDSESVSVTPVSEWLSYTNTKYGYSIKYPAGGKGAEIGFVNLLNDGQKSVKETEDLRISIPRGVFGVIALNISGEKTTDTVSFVGTDEGTNKLLNLPLKDFTETVQGYHINQTGKETKYGTDKRIVGDVKKSIVSEKEAYGFSEVSSGWFITPIGNILVSGNNESHTYIFVENKYGKKFLIWYPSNDKTFESILDTFEFTK